MTGTSASEPGMDGVWGRSPQGDRTEARLARVLALQQLLADVSHRLGPARELAPVLRTVLEAMRSLLDFRGGSICLVDERGVYVAAADVEITPEMAAARVPVGTGLAGRVVATGAPVYSPDLDTDDRIDPELRHLANNLPTKSYLAVPLVCVGRVIGVLQVDSIKTDAFDDEDVRLLVGLATQVAGAIESARLNEEIRDLERLKADFLARVSHELRTPLTIISGFADTLAAHDGQIEGPQRAQMLSRIRDASVRLHGLIDELLTVNQFEVLDPRVERVDLGEVLAGVRSRAVDPSRVEVSVDDGVTLETDPKILGHALTLLVDNALKYGGGAELRGSSRLITVRDHGPGVPAELRADLFERFTRGEHSTPGMGLGLAVARALAQSLGATLELADPTDGRGAQFEVRFGG